MNTPIKEHLRGIRKEEMIRKLKKQNERYREALEYAHYQSDRRKQLRGIEDATYFAWIHDKCAYALRKYRRRCSTNPRD